MRTATGYFRACGSASRHAAKNSFVARADGGIRSPKSPRCTGLLNASTGDWTTAPKRRWISPAYRCSRKA
ncbi:hypothetical protein [Streptomyces sp. AB3(2024)]|uniref:hypothetical protein n=1 Tax=Streptomyces sp. AB3(2024) TaxID=3317321 RepID=UPI0035A3C8AA